MKKNGMILIGFVALMVALGASDSLRGIFSPIFQEHFKLTTSQLAQIVTVSYIGNLFFLLVGGRLIDKFNRKKAMICVIGIWMFALVLFVSTDSYIGILIGMFLAMGTSTLLNTTINIVTPVLFASSPGFLVNFLFFTQGIGTSGSQSAVGNFAKDFSDWKSVNMMLLGLGAAALIVLCFCNIPNNTKKTKEKIGSVEIIKNSAFTYLIFIFGLYFIAEHGILNWLVAYSTKELGLEMGRASNYLAFFFGCITLGRLLLSPLVDKLGVFRSIRYFGTVAAVLYVSGILMGSKVLWLLSASGLFFAIIYPTLVMSIQKLYPSQVVSTASGMIISIASLFDIGFNMGFGKLVDLLGYKVSFMIMPVSMVLFITLFWLFSKDKIKNNNSLEKSDCTIVA
jgi:fucose permease